MKTLSDYVRGHQPTYLVEKSGNLLLVTAKQYQKHYFMIGERVIDVIKTQDYSLYETEIALINHPKDAELIKKRDEDALYKKWLKFVKENKDKK